MKKKFVVLASILIVISMSVVVATDFATGSETGPAPIEPIWHDEEVKVLGASTMSTDIISILQETTTKVTTIDDIEGLKDSILPGEILLIDGKWAKDQPLDQTAEAVKEIIIKGNPIVLIFGEPYLLKKAIEGQNISHGWADGLLAYGIKYSPQCDYSVTFGVGSTIITDTVIRNAILDCVQKAVENIPDDVVKNYENPIGPVSSGMMATSQAYWQYRTTFDWTEYCYPHGNFRIIASYYQLINDATPSYNWYTAKMQLVSMPGDLLWNNNYRTGDMWVRSHIDAVYWLLGNHILHDWDPTTTTGVDYMNVNVGTTAGTGGAGVTAGFGWTFASPDVSCYDIGNAADHLCHWHFDVNQYRDVSKYQYYVLPGHTVRVTDGQGYSGAYEIWGDRYEVRWGKKTWWGHTDWQTYTKLIGGIIYPV